MQPFLERTGEIFMQRAALYIRVSTEEQVMHGYSLEAQREALTKYAKEHDLFIVDYYVDEGKSARKPYRTRPELMRMLGDVEARKIDLILFIKLDRWFRSVGDYYEVQRILDRHHVHWRATEEDYETETASGEFKVNIMLSVAQNEAARTSERIKFVFDAKISRREAISGMVPLGLKIENKHLVHDPEKVGMVRDLFQYYADHGSKHGATQYIFDKYGVEIDRHNFSKMLQNTLYKGEYRGIPDYCEPIIDPTLFDRLNAMPNIKATPRHRVFIFSGLVVCAECGKRMSARHSYNIHGSEYLYYRCNRYSNYKDCINGKMANEQTLEQWLLDNVEDEINKCLAEYKAAAAERRKKPAVDRAAIKRRLTRLNEMYLNNVIGPEEYWPECSKCKAQLAELPEPEEPKVNVQGLKDFLASDFKTAYQSLEREQRRILWRGIIREIRVDAQKRITISFT